MIDIHSHILTGLDDGARTMSESLEMVRMAANSGTTDIVATPHANDRFAYDSDLVEEKILDLRTASRNALRIHKGCDFHLSAANIFDALRKVEKYTINGTQYLLVEPPDLMAPSSISAILTRLRSAGVIPILTHPERNPLLQDRISHIEDFVTSGCLVQVTAMSILGGFDKAAQRASEELLRRGLVHFVASDAHDVRHRPPVLGEARRRITERFGEKVATALFLANAQAVLSGRPCL